MFNANINTKRPIVGPNHSLVMTLILHCVNVYVCYLFTQTVADGGVLIIAHFTQQTFL